MGHSARTEPTCQRRAFGGVGSGLGQVGAVHNVTSIDVQAAMVLLRVNIVGGPGRKDRARAAGIVGPPPAGLMRGWIPLRVKSGEPGDPEPHPPRSDQRNRARAVAFLAGRRHVALVKILPPFLDHLL